MASMVQSVMMGRNALSIIFVYCCLQPALSSYLGYPRIHFSGQYRANINSRNNLPCNYRNDKPLDPDLNTDFNFNGTGDFQFHNVHVTAVVNETGQLSTEDAVVGRNIIGNLRRPFAKLSDIDVEAQTYTTIFGLKLGVQWSNNFPEDDDIAFYGNWTPSVVAQYIWPRVKCYSRSNNDGELYQGSLSLGAQATSVITGVRWLDSRNSTVLIQLREASKAFGGNLAVRVSMHYYTRNYPPYVATNATLGYILGVIGVPSPSDTLNIPGERTMHSTANTPVGLTFEPNNLCFGQDLSGYLPWMYTAPFEVDSVRNEVRFDLSNSLPTDLNNSVRNISTLRLGIYRESDSCVFLLGGPSGIPYASDNDLPITNGIYSIQVDSSLMDEVNTSPLVIVQVVNSDDGRDRICGEGVFSSASGHSAQILLQEFEYFVRPTRYYLGRIDRSTESNPSVQTLFVTRYGHPVQGVGVKVELFNEVIPADGIVPHSSTVTTDSRGMGKFEFSLNEVIPLQRQYTLPPCKDSNATSLPIEGQIYLFSYCVDSESTRCERNDYGVTFAYHAYSDVSYSESPTWVDDVGPIFTQYARLTPIMKKILDLGSYTVVIKPNNINLLNITLRLGFENPSYMPTTRDLSPTKRDMILRWLENPRFNVTDPTDIIEETPVCVPCGSSFAFSNSPEYFTPPRCDPNTQLQLREWPQERESFFGDICTPFLNNPAFILSEDGNDIIAIEGRPLFGVTFDSDAANLKCTKGNIMTQLQSAVQLEWATIPTYLTALYSIVEGCNTEIYDLIRSVIVQEMLHMTLSANMLIAMDGSPLIDDASATPSFPTTLPAGVLPGLVVHLKKLSLQHVYENFMAIEAPQDSQHVINNFTIGAFYSEISHCIDLLDRRGVQLFDPALLSRQVQWPWSPTAKVGSVIQITNAATAIAAVNQIVEQGEGEGLLDLDQIGTDELPHFYKFEAIVCQRHLEMNGEETYTYNGSRIPFRSDGVWPMRDDPTVGNVPPDTNCYTESRAFHNTYRKLLRKLQEVFSDNPDGIFDAINLMESLEVHAKILMWTQFNSDCRTDDTTCGPVWDYNWPLPEPDISVLELALDSSALGNHVSLVHMLLLLATGAYFRSFF